MSKDPLRPQVPLGDAPPSAAIDIEIAHELFETIVGTASTGTPQAAIYEVSTGTAAGVDDGGDA